MDSDDKLALIIITFVFLLIGGLVYVTHRAVSNINDNGGVAKTIGKFIKEVNESSK